MTSAGGIPQGRPKSHKLYDRSAIGNGSDGLASLGGGVIAALAFLILFALAL